MGLSHDFGIEECDDVHVKVMIQFMINTKRMMVLPKDKVV